MDGPLTRRDVVRLGLAVALCGGCVGLEGQRDPDFTVKPLDGEARFPRALLDPPGATLAVEVVGVDTLLVFYTPERELRVTSIVCTHLGCDVAYAPRRRRLECPCHGSAFALDGRVLDGPAEVPLRVYPVRTEGDEIVVTLET